MTTQYIVRVRNRAGVRQYDVTDFLRVEYSKSLNGVGRGTIDIRGNHPAIDVLEKDGQIEVWRYDDATDLAPYCDFFGLYRDRDRATPRGNRNGIFTLKTVEQKHLLWRPTDGFAAGTNNRNDFTNVPAETAMKLMVQYNATSAATTGNGRERSVGTWASYITVQSDGAGGNNVTKAFGHMKLLTALQELAVLGGIDFDLVKTGGRAWEFRTYAQLGSDLTNSVRFSLTWDNLGDPHLVGNAIDEETVAMVWGDGQGAAREFLAVTSDTYNADYNDIEVYVNAANQGTASLQAAGEARLYETRQRDDFTFSVLQTAAYRYGRDYCIAGVLGDIVPVTYYEGTGNQRIRGAHVVYSPQSGGETNERIRLEMVDV